MGIQTRLRPAPSLNPSRVANVLRRTDDEDRSCPQCLTTQSEATPKRSAPTATLAKTARCPGTASTVRGRHNGGNPAMQSSSTPSEVTLADLFAQLEEIKSILVLLVTELHNYGDEPEKKPGVFPSFTLSLEERIAMGRRVHAARRLADLSVREVAEAVGKSPHTVQNWERGQVPRGLIMRERLATALGIEELVLFAEWHAKAEQLERLVSP
jgi:DNA-binding XRE family transcriptional regulator